MVSGVASSPQSVLYSCIPGPIFQSFQALAQQRRPHGYVASWGFQAFISYSFSLQVRYCFNIVLPKLPGVFSVLSCNIGFTILQAIAIISGFSSTQQNQAFNHQFLQTFNQTFLQYCITNISCYIFSSVHQYCIYNITSHKISLFISWVKSSVASTYIGSSSLISCSGSSEGRGAHADESVI